MALIKSQRETLLAPLQSVSGIVERRHTLPILSNVLLEKQGENLTFLATDIEIQITTHTHCVSGEENGAVTVGAKKLQDILRSLPEGTEVTLSLDDKRLQIKAGKSRFNLQTLPADDFPRMALSEGESRTFTVSQRAFLCTATHDVDHPHMPLVTAPIRIGAGAWICAETYVHPGVEIGVDAVAGVRAVVLHAVPPGQIVGGNPAKLLRMRNLEQAGNG